MENKNKNELKEILMDYQLAFESYDALKTLSSIKFGGDKPGQTKYRLCTIIARQLKEYAEEFENVRDDLREKYGKEDFKKEIITDKSGNLREGNFLLDPETNQKISIGKVVKPGSVNFSIFLKELRIFGKKEIPGKIKIPKDNIILTIVGDSGGILEPLGWIISDVIFELEKESTINVFDAKEIKNIMEKIQKKL